MQLSQQYSCQVEVSELSLTANKIFKNKVKTVKPSLALIQLYAICSEVQILKDALCLKKLLPCHEWECNKFRFVRKGLYEFPLKTSQYNITLSVSPILHFILWLFILCLISPVKLNLPFWHRDLKSDSCDGKIVLAVCLRDTFETRLNN